MRVLVPGYGGPFPAVVDRWRMKVAVETLAHAGGGLLIVSGHNGEAERLARLASPGVDVVREPKARSTWENVECSLRALDGADRIAIASDYLHARRALATYASCGLTSRTGRCQRAGVGPGAFGWMLQVPLPC